MANKNILIAILVLVIVILAGVVVYAFVLRPAYTGYVVDRQVEGYNVCVSNFISQLQQNGFVQIDLGNQSIYLAPIVPEQQTQQTETSGQQAG
ncbi:MAG: hypothetical protein AABX50_01475 [Nanoarchaeota archaeon]